MVESEIGKVWIEMGERLRVCEKERGGRS